MAPRRGLEKEFVEQFGELSFHVPPSVSRALAQPPTTTIFGTDVYTIAERVTPTSDLNYPVTATVGTMSTPALPRTIQELNALASALQARAANKETAASLPAVRKGQALEGSPEHKKQKAAPALAPASSPADSILIEKDEEPDEPEVPSMFPLLQHLDYWTDLSPEDAVHQVNGDVFKAAKDPGHPLVLFVWLRGYEVRLTAASSSPCYKLIMGIKAPDYSKYESAVIKLEFKKGAPDNATFRPADDGAPEDYKEQVDHARECKLHSRNPRYDCDLASLDRFTLHGSEHWNYVPLPTLEFHLPWPGEFRQVPRQENQKVEIGRYWALARQAVADVLLRRDWPQLGDGQVAQEVLYADSDDE